MQKKQKIHAVEATVNQIPVSVTIQCPVCEHQRTTPYSEFIAKYGDPPDWTFTRITCPECNTILQIDTQDWT